MTTGVKQNEYDAITEHLPTKGWLAHWMKFTENMETCPRFLFFGACCIMGAAINNKVWIQRGDEGLLPKLMPNPWVILLAPPYRGHKTSCINLGVNCLTQACEDVRILSDKLTPESVVYALSSPNTPKEVIRIGPRDATGLLKAPEMSVIFGKQQYNVGMISLITDLYDYRELWVSETIGRGRQTLRNNCISVFAGSTPTWLQHMIPQDAFSGGFMRRFIIVELPPHFYKRDSDPKLPKGMRWKELVEEFRWFSTIKGQMSWGKGAKEAYKAYYDDFTPSGNEQYDAYKEGMYEQVLKIAMLLDINEGRLELTAGNLIRAKNILQSIEPEIYNRIQSLTTHPRMQTTQDIQDVLKMKGAVSEGELLKAVYKSLSQGERQFYEALSVLRRTGIIEVIGTAGNYSYKLKEVSK